MDLKYYWWSFPKALNDNLCDSIIEHSLNQKIEQGKTGQNFKKNNFKTRDSNIVWLKDEWIYKEIFPYINAANKNAEWNFHWSTSESMQFTIYNKEQHYDWHQDAFPTYKNPSILDCYGLTRKLSVVCQLTDQKKYTGGELVFDTRDYSPEERDKKKHEQIYFELKQKGTIVVFPSFVWHKITPVKKGTRYSLVSWHLGYPFT